MSNYESDNDMRNENSWNMFDLQIGQKCRLDDQMFVRERPTIKWQFFEQMFDRVDEA